MQLGEVRVSRIMAISYLESATGIKCDQLQGFFVDWPNPPDAQTHLKLLHSSDQVVLALDSETRLVVGFITAITDSVLSAYIPLLEVLPNYQGQGVGSELVGRMVAKLNHLYMIDLLCDPKLQPFYEKAGMQQSGVGMLIRNYSNQAG